MPINDDHRKEIESQFADINNKGNTPYGGASHAAAFLEKFVDSKINWAHLDIACAYSIKPSSIYAAGATGHGTQLVVDYLLSESIKEKETKI